MTERRRMSTWQMVALLAISAVGTLVLLAFADTRETLKLKADKSEILGVNERIKYMDDKLDFIILMHIDDKGEVKRREP